MHINSISCGQGAPSIYLLVMAKQGIFPADIVIVADTGDENDMLWNTGERTTAGEFFERVTRPLAEEFGLEAAFVRAVNKNGKPLPAIHHDQTIKSNGIISIDMPLFGVNGGRLRQSCTSKWKKSAIRQELRRRGAKTATTYLGLTMDEVERVKPNTDIKWETLAWPMIMIQKIYRAEIETHLQKMGIPWLKRSQCDKCPHGDLFRWEMHTEQSIDEAAEFEASFNGEFFLTEYRIPLKEAIKLMKSRKPPNSFLSCDGGYCFT